MNLSSLFLLIREIYDKIIEIFLFGIINNFSKEYSFIKILLLLLQAPSILDFERIVSMVIFLRKFVTGVIP